MIGLEERLPTAIETTVFRCAQEALTNIARYAQAKQINIKIAMEDQVVRASIKDDGVGFDPNTLQELNPKGVGGTGFSGMRERVQLLEGHMEINSALGEGTEIKISLPIIKLDANSIKDR
jgi:signal transduction histidine kinase